jgi:HD superfamily phosphohydrolase
MEFLNGPRPKILRTRLYGDQLFTRFELELLHTPVLQRLYNLKQLGFTDRVYPDAIHARFNHVLGATEVVEKMGEKLLAWLVSHKDQEFAYAATTTVSNPENKISAALLAEQLKQNIPALRLMALLHDLTHAAFGHTLEDEVNVFDEKHDDPRRQKRFFDALVAQLLYLWSTEERIRTFDGTVLEKLSDLSLSQDHKQELEWAEELAEYLGSDKGQLASLGRQLRDLELAFRLLLHLDFMHSTDRQPASIHLLVTEVAKVIDVQQGSRDFVLNRDMFMIDLVGNTMCADLLDYARRDADNAGLRIQFDDRFLRYLCVASVKGPLSPDGKPCIRTAIQIFTDKMRYDVLSEMSGILKARYLINERVLFHPTKCAAGAMLGTTVQLLGLRDLPGWMQVLGDQEFLRVLTEIAGNLETLVPRFSAQLTSPRPLSWVEITRSASSLNSRMAEILERCIDWIVPDAPKDEPLTTTQIDSLLLRARSARNVVWRLTARRFPKLAFRLREAHHTGGATEEQVADTYSRPKERYALERRIEDACRLPMGSLFVHCPRRKTSLKVAEVLVVGSDLSRAAQLRNLTQVSPEGLAPYEHEIVAVQDMYRSIWQFSAYLDLAFWYKQPVVEWALERELQFPNDKLLSEELDHEDRGIYGLLAGPLRDDIAPRLLSSVIERVDADVPTRMRLGDAKQDVTAKLRKIINDVAAETAKQENDQLGLPGIGSVK